MKMARKHSLSSLGLEAPFRASPVDVPESPEAFPVLEGLRRPQAKVLRSFHRRIPLKIFIKKRGKEWKRMEKKGKEGYFLRTFQQAFDRSA